MDRDKVGRVFFNTTGGLVKELKIDAQEGPVRVDNKHIVAYTDRLQVTTGIPAGIKSYLLSGETYVNTFTGTGSVFIGSGDPSQKAEMAAKRAEMAARRAETALRN